MRLILFVVLLGLGIVTNAVAGTRVVTSEPKSGMSKPEACKSAIDSAKPLYGDVISVECNCDNDGSGIFPWKCIAIFLIKS